MTKEFVIAHLKKRKKDSARNVLYAYDGPVNDADFYGLLVSMLNSKLIIQHEHTFLLSLPEKPIYTNYRGNL